MWFCLLGGATRISRKQETTVACYILVVECVLLSHKPYSSPFDSTKATTACLPPAAPNSVIFHHSHTYLHTCYRVLYTGQWKGRPCSHEEVHSHESDSYTPQRLVLSGKIPHVYSERTKWPSFYICMHILKHSACAIVWWAHGQLSLALHGNHIQAVIPPPKESLC